jgi:hypothetical protein
VKQFAGSDDAWPEHKESQIMQRNTPMPPLWDAEFPKHRVQAAIDRAKYAQSQRDWRTAEIYVERAMSDVFDQYHCCELSRCRRARHCIGNPPRCWEPRISEQRLPAKVQDSIEKAYALIQIERAAAAREGRPARVLRPAPNTKRRRS